MEYPCIEYVRAAVIQFDSVWKFMIFFYSSIFFLAQVVSVILKLCNSIEGGSIELYFGFASNMHYAHLSASLKSKISKPF